MQDITLKALENFKYYAHYELLNYAASKDLLKIVKVKKENISFEDFCKENHEVNPLFDEEESTYYTEEFKQHFEKVGVYDFVLKCRVSPEKEWENVEIFPLILGDEFIGSGQDSDMLILASQWMRKNPIIGVKSYS